MAAYRRVYDSRHLQAGCKEPGYPTLGNRVGLWATFTFYSRPRHTNSYRYISRIFHLASFVSFSCAEHQCLFSSIFALSSACIAGKWHHPDLFSVAATTSVRAPRSRLLSVP